jgi:mRNA-degrading endonuclease toxin of MazEF toxin-antitoxin module
VDLYALSKVFAEPRVPLSSLPQHGCRSVQRRAAADERRGPARPGCARQIPQRTLRGYSAKVIITADATNGLDADSSAQCQHIRAVATADVRQTLGNIGAVALAQVRDTVAVLLDL